MFRVDKDKCTGCRACVSVCPADAISMVGGKAVIDESKCINCARCVQVCRPGAIYQSSQTSQGSSQFGQNPFQSSGRGMGSGGGRGLGRGPRDGRGGGRGGGGGRGR